MLVARRDSFHPGTHEIPFDQGAGAAIGRAPRLARTVSMLQVVGSLLAIPVGLASGYSIYRANFSPETTCHGLRGSIVSMIDKSIDAGTRRMLVRRDVEKFEQDCGAIDPEATAAFKRLLADKAVPPVAAPVVRRVDTPPQEQVRQIDAPPQATATLPGAAAPAAAGERGRRDPAVSDTQWLDSVRHALIPQDAERAPAVDKTPDAVLHAQWPGQQQASLPPRAAPPPAPAVPAAVSVAAPVAAPVAPALPPAATVAAPPVPQSDASHPVPPAAIPDPADVAAVEPQEHPSRIRHWIAKIPLMGNVINNGW